MRGEVQEDCDKNQISFHTDRFQNYRKICKSVPSAHPARFAAKPRYQAVGVFSRVEDALCHVPGKDITFSGS